MDLGQRIVMLRGRVSQTKLAARAGIDPSTLNRIERGANLNPSQSTLRAIAKALSQVRREKIELSDLLREDGPVSRSEEPRRPSASVELPRDASYLPDDLAEVLYTLKEQIQDAVVIARDARARADEALRLASHRGRRSA